VAGFVTLRYVRDFPHPQPAAYAWLTDFQDSDPGLTDAIQRERRILQRDGNRSVGEVTIEVLGRKGTAQVETTLFPPDRWEARFLSGFSKGNHYTYHLEPTATGCRLTIDYRFAVKRLRHRLLFFFVKPRLRREIDRMWEGFAAAMERDLRGEIPSR